jgi:hypothetical protein
MTRTRKGWRPPPREPNALDLKIAALAPACWRSPVRDWYLSFTRVDNGEREVTHVKEKTYQEVIAMRGEKMKTGKYHVCWIGEEAEA